MTDRTSHHNAERTVRCPIEGCDAEKLARGIHLHILRSSGGGHGPQNEVPEGIDLDNLETVGKQEVEMHYPDERDTEHVARLCPYCAPPYKGKNSVLIHLGQVAGRKSHPQDAGQRHSEEDFPRVEVDEQGNVTSVADFDVESGNSESDKGPATAPAVAPNVCVEFSSSTAGGLHPLIDGTAGWGVT